MVAGGGDIEDLAAQLCAGDRTALARAITLIESTREDHREAAAALLQDILPQTGKAIRLGITGVPGVGKSTLIDQLGTNLIEAGHKVAVLAVDPSSTRTGGSILGDKTRMERLSKDPGAFIRPSPSGATLGGVARRTREAMLLVEAAGFDVVIVETVGIGQSEVTVAGMVDFFLVLALPGAGDELQGIKKGVIELADMVAVNKADGAMADAAMRAAADLRAALHILVPGTAEWRPPVATTSAVENQGLDSIWSEVLRHREILTASGALDARRRTQMVAWFRSLVEEQVLTRFFANPEVAAALPGLEAAVREGAAVPSAAAEEILNTFSAE